MTELERYKEAVAYFRTQLRLLGLDFIHDANRICDGADKILSPPPEYEEVEVVQWGVVAPSGFVETTFHNESPAIGATEDSRSRYFQYSVVKLTGTRRVEKRKVERSATVKFLASPSTTYCHVSGDPMPNSEFNGHLVWQEEA